MNTVSLIIPHFNRQLKCVRLIDAIHQENSCDVEVIIVDDGSKDDVAHVEARCAAYQYRFLRYSENKGPAFARNYGVRHSAGKYVCFLDSDDWILPGFVEALLQMIGKRSPDIGWCGIKEYQFGKSFGQAHVWLSGEYRLTRERTMQGLHVGTNCGLYIKRKFFDKVGGFDSELRHAEDTDFLLRASHYNPRLGVIDASLIAVDKSGTDRVTINYNAKAEAYKRIIPKHEDWFAEHPNDRVKFVYKLGWSYLHAGRITEAREQLLKTIRQQWHLAAASLWILSYIGGSKTIIVHRSVSMWRKQLNRFLHNTLLV